MGWRSGGCGCGTGVGCSDGQLTPVCVVQGEPVSLVFAASSPVSGELVRAEVRTQPAGGRLLFDLAPFCSSSAGDPVVLLVDVPGVVTGEWDSSGYYDVWVGDERVGFGPFILELAVSMRPGRLVVVQSWTPSLVVGVPFVRDVSVAGLMPAGEEVSLSPGAAEPEFVVTGVDGSERFFGKGDPWVVVSPDGAAVHLALSGEDVSSIGVGRFTYSLVVFNEYGERRTLLAGMLLVEEGAYVGQVGG